MVTLALLLASPSTWAQSAQADEPAVGQADEPAVAQADSTTKRQKARWQAGISAGISSVFSSNLFHVHPRRLDEFATDNDIGQRYYNMNGPWDVVTKVDGEALSTWRLKKERKLELAAGASYFVPARNTQAKYLRARVSLRFDLNKNDRLRARVRLAPDRFRKNYAREVDGDRVYERAAYLQWDARGEYRHDWSKQWNMAFGYRFSQRRFDSAFFGRDRTWHEVGVQSSHDLSKKLEFSIDAAAGIASSPQQIEFGINVDRSFYAVRFGVEVDWDMLKNWTLTLGTSLRMRQYTSANLANPAYHNRQDVRLRFDAKMRVKLDTNSRLVIAAGLLDNNSNREDPGSDVNEAGYQEFTGAISFAFSL